MSISQSATARAKSSWSVKAAGSRAARSNWLSGAVNRQQGRLTEAVQNLRSVLNDRTPEMIQRKFDFSKDYVVINLLGQTLFDLGRHLLAKGFGRAAIEYKSISRELQQVGVLDPASANLLYQMAGYRNRLVHFYDEVTVEELYRVCTQDLADVDRVIETIAQWIRDHPDRIDESL